MTIHRCRRGRAGGAILTALALAVAPAGAAPPQPTGRQVLEAAGVAGGLVVHLGCGGGELTAGLLGGAAYRVHGLDRGADNVAAARGHIHSLGLTGKVSVAHLTGSRLPYVDNLVNLLVAGDLAGVPAEEVTRVLAPGGVAYLGDGEKWVKTVKPRPKDIDEWTHYLHDSSNNAVAHDSVVGPPRRLQWVAGPRWSRHHDHMSSVSAAVSAGGRVFYILDEGSRSSILLPSKWTLIARDAFSGCPLWQRSISQWHTRMERLKRGPAQLTRRLVAVGGRVYVTLGLGEPLSELDAVTGETVRTIEPGVPAEEVVCNDGVLFLVQRGGTEVAAVRAETGALLWRKRAAAATGTLAADGRAAYFHDGQRVVCLDRADGKERWRSEPVARVGGHSGFAPSLVVHEDVVLFAGGDQKMTALSAESGKTLWTSKHHRGGHNSPQDLLVVGGLVWSGAIANGADSGVWTGYDLKTGKVGSEFLPDVNTYWFHHRCHRAKATDRYLLPSRTGIEFVDFRAKTWEPHHWVRGACLYGIMPCNGLIYAPPHPCACYPEAKLDGFNVLAPASGGPRIPAEAAAEERLVRAPAYQDAQVDRPAAGDENDWPAYRHDSARSGRSKTTVPAELTEAWKTDLGGDGVRLSSLTVAGGQIFLAQIDLHTVWALDAQSGKRLWSFTAGGRVDSPPTVHEGMALFGSADGFVYCLRAADGALVWRFRAAPMEQYLMAMDQIESVWPVHGSVLVQDGAACFVAGRGLFVDGGMWLYRLEARTGKILSVTHMDERNPETGKNLQDRVKGLDMPVARPDVLSSDGRRMYMKSQVFDLKGRRGPVGPAGGQSGPEAHLFCPSSLLDDAMWHRSYWVYGRSFSGGHAGYSQAGKSAPSGRILVFDERSVYGYGRKPQYYRWTTPIEYHLWSAEKEPPAGAKASPAEGKAPPGGAKARSAGGGARRQTAGTGVFVAPSAGLNPAGKPLVVEAWVKADRPDGVVLAHGGPANGCALAIVAGLPRFAVRSAKRLAEAAGTEKVTGEWVHLAGVLTADKKLQVYVNGKLAGAGEAPGLIAEEPVQGLEIGQDAGGAVGGYNSPLAFTGAIDEVRVYHGTVTPAEIARHAAAPGEKAAEKAQLVLCMSFDAGDAKDSSGGGNHGRVEGATPVEGKVGKALSFGSPPAAEGTEGALPTVQPEAPPGPAAASAPATRPAGGGRVASRQGGSKVRHNWSKEIPLTVRAMVLAGDVLFIAGPPDLLDEEEAVRGLASQKVQADLLQQDAALAGRKGALLWAVSAKDGARLSEVRLTAPPAWDGLAAANGRLYLATADGKVLCLAGK